MKQASLQIELSKDNWRWITRGESILSTGYSIYKDRNVSPRMLKEIKECFPFQTFRIWF